ncbi:MAG: hypothetical protein PVI90_14945, partial [Desulfobacteraceae bacterium]
MSETIKTAAEQAEMNMESVLTHEEQRKITLQIGSVLFAGGLLLAGEIYQLILPGYDSVAGIILFIGAVIAGFAIFRRAIKGFVQRDSKHIMEQLVSLALLASISKGDYQTAILIPLVMAIVHFLEERSILGAKSAIEGLKTLQAKEA